jgi:phytanoyl-CoA hydroxylase
VKDSGPHVPSSASGTPSAPRDPDFRYCRRGSGQGEGDFEMSRAISERDRTRYEESGYLVVRELFSPEELLPWCERLRAILAGEQPPAERMLVMRDVMVAKGVVRPADRERRIAKLQDFENDPVLRSYVEHRRILDRVEAFTGPDIASIHTMLVNKPPGVDGRHPLHQDLLYFPFRPADRIVASWTALERCTRENGCLAVVPGSHLGGLRPHENPRWEYLNLGYFGAREVGAHEGRVHLEMEAGDTVFFHPLLLHGSGRNRSQGFRRAISAHYASARCRFLDDGLPHGGRPYVLVRGRAHRDGILGGTSGGAGADPSSHGERRLASPASPEEPEKEAPCPSIPQPSAPSASPCAARGIPRTRCSTPSAWAPAWTSWPSPPRTPGTCPSACSPPSP